MSCEKSENDFIEFIGTETDMFKLIRQFESIGVSTEVAKMVAESGEFNWLLKSLKSEKEYAEFLSRSGMLVSEMLGATDKINCQSFDKPTILFSDKMSLHVLEKIIQGSDENFLAHIFTNM